jgi:hypothetical protein
MSTPTKPDIKTKFSEQEVANQSFDTEFGVQAVELLGHNVANNDLRRVAVDDNGNFNISATVSGADGAIQDGVSSTIKATVKDLTNSNPLTVAITDGNGDQITSFGGGTQYTEGDIDASITGTAMMVEDAANTLQPAQGNKTDGLLVNLGTNNDVTVTGSVTANAGTNLNTSALAIESGGNLASIKTNTDKIPSQGQALAGASMPVVLPASQITTLTPPTSVTVNTISGFATATNQTDKSQFTKITDGTDTALVTALGEQNVLDTNSGAIKTAIESVNTKMVSGTDIGDVTINNGTGAGAVNVQDGGNSLTVDGTVTANISGSISNTSFAVTQGTGTNLHTVVDSGSVTVGNSTGASAVNIQDGGNTITVDGTVSANATLAAETTKVIGVTRSADGSGNLLTSTTNALDVNIKSGSIANTSFTVTQGTGTNLHAVLDAGSAAIGKLAANSGVDIGDVDVLSIAAGTNTIGDVGIKPRTTGGFTTYHLASAATTNATVVKASAGQLFGWYIYNSNAAARKLVFHNTASTPTAGASVFFSVVIPAGGAANVFSDVGIAFSTGIAITTVTGLADNDAVAVAANDLIINLFYS